MVASVEVRVHGAEPVKAQYRSVILSVILMLFISNTREKRKMIIECHVFLFEGFIET